MVEKKYALLKKKPKEEPPQRVNIGALVDKTLWRKFRSVALMDGITTGELLDKAMEEYLKKHK